MTTLAALLFAGFSSTALARPIKVTSDQASATSICPEDEGVNYEAKNMVDSKLSTVWVEGLTGSGLGESVTLDLGETKTINALRLWNGNWYSNDFWSRHNRMKDIEVSFSDGTKQTFTLKDEMVPETLTFPKPVSTSSIKIKYKSVYSGSTFQDTVISEIQLLDGQPDAFFMPVGYAASSTYPADADGNYEANLTTDYMLDSMWCENNQTGDGTGEWIEYNFGQPRTISKLVVNNGNALSIAYNTKANRATAATLTFDDGSTQQIALKPMPTAQTISFVSKTTSKVKISFTTVQKGTEFNDLCLSEARFEP